MTLLLKAISITIKDDFVAFASPENNYQFGGGLTADVKIFKLLKSANESKSPDEIKKI